MKQHRFLRAHVGGYQMVTLGRYAAPQRDVFAPPRKRRKQVSAAEALLQA